jgi:pyruvate formate lyase activating enzyme
MWLRYVLVPGVTDDTGDIARLAAFAATLGNVERVDVLPFHQIGKYKWAQLDLPYTLPDTEPPDQQHVQRTLDVFRREGLIAY